MRRSLSLVLLTVALVALVHGGHGAVAAPRGNRGTKTPPAAAKSPQADAAGTTAELAPPELRLPATIRPLGYTLELTVVPEREDYQGTVTIPLQLDAPTRVIWLHATDLRIESADITPEATTATAKADKGPAARRLAARVVPGGEDFVGFALAETLRPGRATLTVRFAGRMDSTRSRGLYRQSEGSEGGGGPGDPGGSGSPGGLGDKGNNWYAYTFFEPIDARRAFPCFDEPGFKVPWRLVFHVRKDHVALGNAKEESQADEPGGMKVVRLAETPPLPSYLVAFIVGPFDLVEGQAAGRNGTPFRIAVPRGRRDEAAYALAVTPRIVGLLEDYTGIPYPYGKLDVAVVPRFWGTMEHPGLVALGQPLTLIKKTEETLQRHQRYANIAIHELAHYWFGDLVTMRWWDDTWLNESLASWFDAKITDRLEPSWRFSLDRVWQLRAGTMTADSLVTAQSIRLPVTTKHAIAASFDNNITYGKGNAILTMFEAWLGEEKFQKFIHDYLAAHAHGNATAEDFLAKLQEHAGAEVAAAYRSFLEQPGVPLVSVALRCGAGQPPRLTLSQERYLPLGSRGSGEQLWRVPVCVKYSASGKVRRSCTLLGERQAEVVLDEASGRCPEWVMANADAAGYYRVGYAPNLLGQLVAAAKELTLAERMALISDVAARVARGDLLQGEALGLVPGFLAADPDRHVLNSTLELTGVRRELLPAELQSRYERFLLKTYGPRARALGWQPKSGEPEDATLARPNLLALATLGGGDPQLVARAGMLARRWLDGHQAGSAPGAPVVSDELVNPVLTVAARRGDRALQERYLAAAKATEDRRVRSQILGAVGAFDDPALVRAALAKVLSDEFDLRESISIVGGVLGNWKTRELAYAFVKENYDTLAARMRSDEFQLVFHLPGTFCDAAHRADAASFFAERAARVDGGPRSLEQALERVDLCVARQARHLPSVIEFLKKQ